MFGFNEKKPKEEKEKKQEKIVEEISTKESRFSSNIDELARFMCKSNDEKDVFDQKVEIYKFFRETLNYEFYELFPFSFTYVNRYGFDTECIVDVRNSNIHYRYVSLPILKNHIRLPDRYSVDYIVNTLKLSSFINDKLFIKTIGRIIEDAYTADYQSNYLTQNLNENAILKETYVFFDNLCKDYKKTYVQFILEHANLFAETENVNDSKVLVANNIAVE